MRRKGLLLTVLLAMCTLLSGCWDFIEVNRSSLLTGIAVEAGDNGELNVTFEILNPAEAQRVQSSSGGPSTILHTIKGKTLADTASRLNELVDRRIILSHIRAVVLDERIARKGLDLINDVLQRSHYIREDILLVVAKDVPASTILKVMYPSGMYASSRLRAQTENFYRMWGGFPRSALYDYSEAIITEGRELTLGAVTATGIPEESVDADSVKSSSPKSEIEISGAAIFKKDQLLGFLPVSDTRVLNLVRDQIKNTLFTVPLDQHGNTATIRMKKLHSKMKVHLDDRQQASLRLEIEGEGQLNSINLDMPLDKPEGIRELETKVSKYLEHQVSSSIQQVQHKYGVDIYGFGEHLYRHKYRRFQEVKKDWNAHFAEANVDISSHIVISRTELKTRKIKNRNWVE